MLEVVASQHATPQRKHCATYRTEAELTFSEISFSFFAEINKRPRHAGDLPCSPKPAAGVGGAAGAPLLPRLLEPADVEDHIPGAPAGGQGKLASASGELREPPPRRAPRGWREFHGQPPAAGVVVSSAALLCASPAC